MLKTAEFSKSRADMFRDRAGELRTLAGQLKSDEHKRLLLESAENYEKLAEVEAKGPGAQLACG